MAQKYMKELGSASFYVHDVLCCPKAKEKYCIHLSKNLSEFMICKWFSNKVCNLL